MKAFGTHYMKESKVGAKVYYEKRFSEKSKSTRTAKMRERCVAAAAEGCASGSVGILFVKAEKEVCNKNIQKDCTVHSTSHILKIVVYILQIISLKRCSKTCVA